MAEPHEQEFDIPSGVKIVKADKWLWELYYEGDDEPFAEIKNWYGDDAWQAWYRGEPLNKDFKAVGDPQTRLLSVYGCYTSSEDAIAAIVDRIKKDETPR